MYRSSSAFKLTMTIAVGASGCGLAVTASGTGSGTATGTALVSTSRSHDSAVAAVAAHSLSKCVSREREDSPDVWWDDSGGVRSRCGFLYTWSPYATRGKPATGDVSGEFGCALATRIALGAFARGEFAMRGAPSIVNDAVCVPIARDAHLVLLSPLGTCEDVQDDDACVRAPTANCDEAADCVKPVCVPPIVGVSSIAAVVTSGRVAAVGVGDRRLFPSDDLPCGVAVGVSASNDLSRTWRIRWWDRGEASESGSCADGWSLR
jgi:hypothetical protein